MSLQSQNECIKYLENDVMGSQKLNKSCFDNFGVNLYKFISLSQLTSQIDDYLIDADVNSLYPAAMKEEYLTGVRIRMNDLFIVHFNEFLERFEHCPKYGIYQIENIANKNQN